MTAKKQIDKVGRVSGRNTGIDILKMISMAFVVMLHTLGHGGVLAAVKGSGGPYYTAWWLETAAMPAVDIFALITGYVSINSEFRSGRHISRYVVTWLQVVFYGIAIVLIVQLMAPEWVTRTDFFNALFPVTNNMYWYFTAYTGMMMLVPVLHNGIRAMGDRDLKWLLVILLIGFAGFDTVVSRFSLNSGYSVIWLILMYVTGAIIRKTELGKNLSPIICVILIAVMYGAAYILKISEFELQIMAAVIEPGTMMLYTSPLIAGAAILYLILFSKLQFSNTCGKIVSFFAPGTFAVYLINDNRVLREHLIVDKFTFMAGYSGGKIAVYIVLFALSFTLAALLIDKCRQMIFNQLNIKNKLEAGLDQAFQRR